MAQNSIIRCVFAIAFLALSAKAQGPGGAYCKDWDGTCPVDAQRRSNDDFHHCSDGSCDESDCCGTSCENFHDCPADTKKRNYGHMVWGSADVKSECCVRTCFDNFHGTCPHGKSVRGEHDWHDCQDNCHSPDECCEESPAYCKNWNGTCPLDTYRRSGEDMHRCKGNQCDQDECCGQRCHSWDGECAVGEKRPYHDGHTFYGGYNMADECCIQRCANNFHGICPKNMSVRGDHDWHNCRDNCESPDECCVDTEHDCGAYHGECPEGEEKIPDDQERKFRQWTGDGHDSARYQCCAKKCNDEPDRQCTAPKLRRPDDHNAMFKTTGEHETFEDRCCVAQCHTNFKGTCPIGLKVRNSDDWHSCIHGTEDRCQEPGECCQGYCEDHFNGTCPAGTDFDPSEYCIEDGRNKCNEERCCKEPSLCPNEVMAPPSARMTCTKTPENCEELEQITCPGGCFHQCAAQGSNKAFLMGYASNMYCDTTNWCDGTFNGGHFGGGGNHKCKAGACCGRGTVMGKHGKCVVDNGKVFRGCHNGEENTLFGCVSSREEERRCGGQTTPPVRRL